MSLARTNLPGPLQDQADKAWSGILDRADESTRLRLEARAGEDPVAPQLPRILACSPFVADLARRKPQLFADTLDGEFLQSQMAEDQFLAELTGQLQGEDVDLGSVLRQFRQRHMLRIVWRDFSRLADTLETVRDTSLLAEACITAALEHSHAAMEQRFAVPRGRESGEPQQLIVLGMGKLGARELNVLSLIHI